MIHLEPPPAERPPVAPVLAERPRSGPPTPRIAQNPYGASFWLCYAANASLTTAIALLFRYDDFVRSFGGAEYQLGWIVGIGMIGSLAMRAWQGAGIDHYGPRRVWLCSVGLYIVAIFGHLTVTDIHSPWVYGLRILFCIAVAGAFGSSITYISRTVPPQRMAEIVGTLGTSGFVGIALGPAIGDRLLGPGALMENGLPAMFLASAALACVSWIAIFAATRGVEPPPRRRRPPSLWLLRRYHPGAVLLIGMTMGLGLGLPGTFLRGFTRDLGIDKMEIFFWVYTATAFAARIATRRLPERIGVRPMILLGQAALVASLLAYLLVESYAALALPAVFTGIAHAVLFPAVLAGGSLRFPVRYRGLATTLMLASMDIGTLLGAPMIGAILHAAQWSELPAYPTMFVLIGVILGTCALVYAICTSRAKQA
jgi:MFS family permease